MTTQPQATPGHPTLHWADGADEGSSRPPVTDRFRPTASSWRPCHTMSSVDLLSPAQTCRVLDLAQAELLDAVNDGSLPAYNIGGEIRFRMTEVAALQGATRGSAA